MSTEVLQRRFNEIGAHLQVQDGPWRGVPRIDVLGSTFDVRFGRGRESVELEVVDVKPHDRHLLLLTRVDGEKSKFLCGHDERHWFVAAIPEAARGVTGVADAKAALQPDIVRASLGRVRPKDRLRRRNAVFVRQGEWFFVPAPNVAVDDRGVVRNEPLARAGGTPHVLQFAFRRGGRTVYVRRGNTRSLTPAQFGRLSPTERRHWSPMTADPELYAKGTVRHPDHATILLRSWHRVVMNTEAGARAMRFVTFVD
jgi:hypothetical protein